MASTALTLEQIVDAMVAEKVERAVAPLRLELERLRAANGGADPILSTEEAAREAKVKPRTITAWARSGRLRAGAPPYRIRRSDLLAAVARAPFRRTGEVEPEALADAVLDRARRAS